MCDIEEDDDDDDGDVEKREEAEGQQKEAKEDRGDGRALKRTHSGSLPISQLGQSIKYRHKLAATSSK